MENIELVDIGANLTHKDFSADLDSVIEEALNNNIAKKLLLAPQDKRGLRPQT